jgi:ring-1,2-phenylacetyl-CoA epoxidase subunit PaaC
MTNLAIAKLNYTLRLADDALIIGHRLSEWCGHGPILEQDIALTNTALDHLGRARSLYQYAAEQFNFMNEEERSGIFTSVALQNIINAAVPVTEDDLAYLRDGWDFKNIILLEQPNIDWAYTVARSFSYDSFNFFFYSALQQSTDKLLAAIAEKSLKEVTYHLRWSSEWMVRLGDGTDESHMRIQKAVNELWMYTGELFSMTEDERTLQSSGIAVDLEQLKQPWSQSVQSIFEQANVALPKQGWMQNGGKEGRHSEHLGYILAELQFMQRAYPGMTW